MCSWTSLYWQKGEFPWSGPFKIKVCPQCKKLTNTGKQQDVGGLPHSPPSSFGGLPSPTTASCHDTVGSAAAHNHLPTAYCVGVSCFLYCTLGTPLDCT